MAIVIRLALVARVPREGVPAFGAFEALVLPLMAHYGGQLERRVRSADGALEIHLISFPDTDALDAFRADQRRAAAMELLSASGAQVTLEAIEDVKDDPAAHPAFVFGAMSPYSWMAAERVEALLGPVRWWPVFAGGLFKARGRPSWGLSAQRAAGVADCERRAAQHGLGPIAWPRGWPTVDLKIARALTYAARHDAVRQLALAAMRLAFLEGRDLDDIDTVAEAAGRAGLQPGETVAALDDDIVKRATRTATDEAYARGVRGIPTVLVEGQAIWGDDRLGEAAAIHRRSRAQG